MPQIINTVNKYSAADAVIPLPVGKKMYAVLGAQSKNILVRMNGTETIILNNVSSRELWFPVPLEFAAAAEIVFRSTSSTGDCSVILDQ